MIYALQRVGSYRRNSGQTSPQPQQTSNNGMLAKPSVAAMVASTPDPHCIISLEGVARRAIDERGSTTLKIPLERPIAGSQHQMVNLSTDPDNLYPTTPLINENVSFFSVFNRLIVCSSRLSGHQLSLGDHRRVSTSTVAAYLNVINNCTEDNKNYPDVQN